MAASYCNHLYLHMDTLQYFLSTPSRYRRDAVIVCSALLMFTLTPAFWLFGRLQPITFDSMVIAEASSSPLPSGNASAIPAAASVSSAPGWPAKGVVTAEFGVGGHPFTGVHTGIDIAGPANQPIVAFRPGVVTQAGAISGGCGRCVFVDHGGGLVSHYSHMSSIAATVGQQVAAGTVLGYQGNTGWSTGPHVHFEIKLNGIPVNPRNYVGGNPVR